MLTSVFVLFYWSWNCQVEIKLTMVHEEKNPIQTKLPVKRYLKIADHITRDKDKIRRR